MISLIQLGHTKLILISSHKKLKKFEQQLFMLIVIQFSILGHIILMKWILNTLLITHYPKKLVKFLIHIEMCTSFGFPSLKHKTDVRMTNSLMPLNNFALLIK